MHTFSLPMTWDVSHMIEAISTQGFCVIENAHDHYYSQQVRVECLTHLNQFRGAAIQNGINNDIRRDHILWIDTQLEVAQQHLEALQHLSDEFNRAFFLGINDVEAHFACYNAGEFYALHRDNPLGKNGRAISCVYYLHEQWQTSWGGQLRLKDTNNVWHTIEPAANRMVLFQSDLLHEVLEAKHQRLSITAWLRNDQNVFA